VFNCAITPSPMCVPARISMITGKYPSETGMWNNKARKTEEDYLTCYFKNAGYNTASFGKRHYETDESAFETEISIEYSDEVDAQDYNEKYDEKEYDVIKYRGKTRWILGGVFPAAATETQESRLIEHAKKFLEQTGNEPFLVRLSFTGPHTPVSVPQPFDTVIDDDRIKIPVETEGRRKEMPSWARILADEYSGSDRLTRQEIEKARRYYYGYVSYIDFEIGKFLGWMKNKGLLDNTIVVFVSDHGTHIGDYGFVQKQTFYDPVVNVPFIFWYPGHFKAETKINTPVETRWLLPTLLDIAGIDMPERTNCNFLTNTLKRGVEPESKIVRSEFILNSIPRLDKDRIFIVRDGEWKLSACYDENNRLKDVFLHNMLKDPYEQENLSHNDNYKKISDRLIKEIEKCIKDN
ncbi:MAG TPA: sulfatase-like hydrolase/transferase, partial [Clostridia bacterium]